MHVQTYVKAEENRNQPHATLVEAPRPAPSLRVKTHVKAGDPWPNHNETLVRAW